MGIFRNKDSSAILRAPCRFKAPKGLACCFQCIAERSELVVWWIACDVQKMEHPVRIVHIKHVVTGSIPVERTLSHWNQDFGTKSCVASTRKALNWVNLSWYTWNCLQSYWRFGQLRSLAYSVSFFSLRGTDEGRPQSNVLKHLLGVTVILLMIQKLCWAHMSFCRLCFLPAVKTRV